MPICILLTVHIVVAIAFVLVLRFAPKGEWQTARTLAEAPADDAAIAQIKTAAQTGELAQLTRSLTAFKPSETTEDKSFEFARDKAFRAIDYSIKRHDWYEDQRSRMFQAIGAQLGGIVSRSTSTPFVIPAQRWSVATAYGRIAPCRDPACRRLRGSRPSLRSAGMTNGAIPSGRKPF